VACEYLACGFGLVPNVELPALLGCRISRATVWTDAWQQTSIPAVYSAGECTGIGGLDAAVVEGRIAGLAATGQHTVARAWFRHRDRTHRFALALARDFALRGEVTALSTDDTIVCRCEDVTYGALRRHESWRGAKLQTRCGMGLCQGRICGSAASRLFGWETGQPRPPISPIPLGAIMVMVDQGRESGT
jgi:NADPH-dependent 2,4-dienoyl-CoA reductase/sulfur reductase-like enzyme